MEEHTKRVMIIGGGIAGIQASLDLGDMDYQVDLIEQKPCIGGRMAQLDKTLPTNDCSICILAPKLSDCFRHPQIKIHSLTQIEAVKKIGKKFDVTLKRQARFVDESACINCGQCVAKCPVKVDDQFDMEMRKRKAIYLYYLQGIPAVMAIDKEYCLRLKNLDKNKEVCGLCQKVCPKDAIDFMQTDELYHLETDAIIVAIGSNQYDPSPLHLYGYKRYKNVITGLEYERMISASGPTSGHIRRLSDNKPPKTIAFIQCVGSRDIRTNSYCSSICCTYSTKHAILSKEHDPELQSYIFYIDLRAGGKNFQKYVDRAKNEYNVKYIRGKVAEIKIDENDNPILYYEDLNTFEIKTKKVELVILASAMIPTKNSDKITSILDLELDEFNFIKTNLETPVSTNISGIFACGTCLGPMDIPHSVVNASGAAAKAAEYLYKLNR
ncbi:MAG: FAD-dependent oxidoreductase [Candidatus Lokiarchaeota archaeon]|nr:FAD-dependent oxidoreductase [Candidatus Harpocratesius repetitus]